MVYSQAAFTAMMPVSLAWCLVVSLYRRVFPSKIMNANLPDDWSIAAPADRKIVLITGCNCGIGLETALGVADRGCYVVCGCRTIEKCKQAVEAIGPSRSGYVCELDLSSLASVRRFARRFDEEHGRVDVIVNNAGMNGRGVSEDGMDLCYQVGCASWWSFGRS